MSDISPVEALPNFLERSRKFYKADSCTDLDFAACLRKETQPNRNLVPRSDDRLEKKVSRKNEERAPVENFSDNDFEEEVRSRKVKRKHRSDDQDAGLAASGAGTLMAVQHPSQEKVVQNSTCPTESGNGAEVDVAAQGSLEKGQIAATTQEQPAVNKVVITPDDVSIKADAKELPQELAVKVDATPPKVLQADDSKLDQQAVKPPDIARPKLENPDMTQVALNQALKGDQMVLKPAVSGATEPDKEVTQNVGLEKGPDNQTVLDVKGMELSQSGVLKTADMQFSPGEPARVAEARSTDILQQVNSGFEKLISSGKSSIQMHLYPEELGRIGLRLTNTADGMMVVITPEQQTASHLLAQHANELRQSLENAGVKLSGLSINQGQSQGASANSQGWHSHKSQSYPQAAVVRQEVKQEVQTGITTHSDPTSSVDYRI